MRARGQADVIEEVKEGESGNVGGRRERGGATEVEASWRESKGRGVTLRQVVQGLIRLTLSSLASYSLNPKS